LLEKAMKLYGPPAAICPHATGTAVQAVADPATFRRTFPDAVPSLHLLKPLLGHTIGASGLLEAVVLARFARDRQLPPNLPGLHAPPGLNLPKRVLDVTGPIHKLAHGMGGHNALLVLSPP
jgi:3-oxoacyl-[acyl-carrier-protein] synthase II